jgi:hypothetical protein
VINAGAVWPITQLLDTAPPKSTFVRNASWCLSNLCRGKPAPKFERIAPAIPSLAKVFIEHSDEDIIHDICWAFSHLTDMGQQTIPFLIEQNVLQKLIKLVEHTSITFSIPCLRILGNILTGDEMQT